MSFQQVVLFGSVYKMDRALHERDWTLRRQGQFSAIWYRDMSRYMHLLKQVQSIRIGVKRVIK